MTIFRVRRPRPTPLMTTRRMIKLIPSNYYHLLVQRSLRQDIRFSNRARVLRQIRTYRTLLVRGSFMPWTTRTGRHGSRQGCMGATSTRVILRVLPQPIFLCDTESLTVGVKKKKIIPLCHVAHELTSRTYGEKKYWVVIVKDQ